jgi:DNA-binding PadR family transcriptional regulator
VLGLLKNTPMSGSEIMMRVEEQTEGLWKPSPGSIYPLLAWFKENDYTKEITTVEKGIKRYALTEKGERFFEEQIKQKETIQKKLARAPFFQLFLNARTRAKLQKPFWRFIRGMMELRMSLGEDFSDQEVDELITVLDDITKKIEDLTKKVKTPTSKQSK